MHVKRGPKTQTPQGSEFAVTNLMFINICSLAKTKSRVRAPAALEADIKRWTSIFVWSLKRIWNSMCLMLLWTFHITRSIEGIGTGQAIIKETTTELQSTQEIICLSLMFLGLIYMNWSASHCSSPRNTICLFVAFTILQSTGTISVY